MENTGFKRSFLKVFFIFALLTAILLPAGSLAAADDINSSLDYISSFQTLDGGIKESGTSSSSFLTSSWSALAYAALGYDIATVKTGDSLSLLEYLKTSACTLTSTTDIEKGIMALSSANQDPRTFAGCDLLARLNANFDPTSGKIGPDLVSTVFGLIALESARAGVDPLTVGFIKSSQSTDGGWESGWGTEANFTAQTIQGLISAGVDPTDPVIGAAKIYIKGLQTPSGGIKYDANAWTTEPDAFSDAYALQAIYALGEKPTDIFWANSGKTVLDDLESLRNLDGSYNFSKTYGKMNPVWTTAIVLPALKATPYPIMGVELTSYSKSVIVTPLPNAKLSPNSSQTDFLSEEDTAAVSTSTVDPPSILTEPKKLSQTTESTNYAPTVKTQTALDQGSRSQEKVLGIQDAQLQSESPNYLKISIIAFFIGIILSFLPAVLRKFNHRKFNITIYITFVLAGSVALFFPQSSWAANRAGVVVRHSDGSVTKRCVEFNQDSISGLDLLSQAKLNPVVDRGFLVEIDGEEAKSAWEAGASSDYWSYWLFKASNWVYSVSGVQSARVVNGDINGWQKGTGGLLLQKTSFGNVCPEDDQLQKSTTTIQEQAALTYQQEADVKNNAVATNQNSDLNTVFSPENTTSKPPQNQPQVLGASIDKNPNYKYLVLVVFLVLGLACGFVAQRIYFKKKNILKKF